jgi:hypothetical protein
MKKLSTGAPSTLGSYRKLCLVFFGPDSAPVRYFDEQIAKSPEGYDEEVIADESQMMYLIGVLLQGKEVP